MNNVNMVQNNTDFLSTYLKFKIEENFINKGRITESLYNIDLPIIFVKLVRLLALN